MKKRCYKVGLIISTFLHLGTAEAWPANSIAVSPTQPSVVQGQTITITADRPARFVLRGPGTLSSSSGSSVVYTAPLALEPQHTIGGCVATPADSIFNTPIDRLPKSPSSDSWVVFATSNGINVAYQWGFNFTDDSLAATPQTFYYSRLLNNVPFQIPVLDKKRETGAFAFDGNNDHHVVTVNTNTCRFYETYQDGDPFASICPACTAASGWTYVGTDYQQPSSSDGGGTTDAAGLPLAPLTLHLEELRSGTVRHALRVTACAGCISSDHQWPATGSTGAQVGAPPMGTRFRLKNTFDASTFPPSAQTVLAALKQYGMILSDIGTSGTITAASDVTEDPQVVNELSTLVAAHLTYTDFEAVDESSLMLSENSMRVDRNNPYQPPSNSAEVFVSDIDDATNAIRVPISLRRIAIGTPEPSIVVQAGTPAFPIPYWVNGATSAEIKWAISPADEAGSVTPDGTYTPPAHVAIVTKAVLTATSAMSATEPTTIELTIVPEGIIRIDSGSRTETRDDGGNMWLPDLAFETGSFTSDNDTYPTGIWGSVSDSQIWGTQMYTYGDDIVYRMRVPNGRYKVTLMFARTGCEGTYSIGPFNNGLIIGPLHLESQHQIQYHSWDLAAATNYQCRVPKTVELPAEVTNTMLEFALRSIGSGDRQSVPMLNGVTIAPDQSTPHFTIDTQGKSVVQAGSQLQLYVTDWYLPSHATKWSIVSGPGTISATGLFTAPRSSSGAYTRILATGVGILPRATVTLFIPPSS